MTRKIRRGGKVWINVFPDKPVTKKPAETRMGSGKGSPEGWVAVVKPGRVMFELAGVSGDARPRRDAPRRAQAPRKDQVRVARRLMATSARDLRDLTDTELAEHIATARRELFGLRFQNATGELENTAGLRAGRRELARALTIGSERKAAHAPRVREQMADEETQAEDSEPVADAAPPAPDEATRTHRSPTRCERAEANPCRGRSRPEPEAARSSPQLTLSESDAPAKAEVAAATPAPSAEAPQEVSTQRSVAGRARQALTSRAARPHAAGASRRARRAARPERQGARRAPPQGCARRSRPAQRRRSRRAGRARHPEDAPGHRRLRQGGEDDHRAHRHLAPPPPLPEDRPELEDAPRPRRARRSA